MDEDLERNISFNWRGKVATEQYNISGLFYVLPWVKSKYDPSATTQNRYQATTGK